MQMFNSIPEHHLPAAKPKPIDLRTVEETAGWVWSGNLNLSYHIVIVVICGLFYFIKVSAILKVFYIVNVLGVNVPLIDYFSNNYQ